MPSKTVFLTVLLGMVALFSGVAQAKLVSAPADYKVVGTFAEAKELTAADTYVWLTDTVTGDIVDVVQQAVWIRKLAIYNTHAAEADLIEFLAALPSIEYLYLSNARLSAPFMKQLEQCESLTTLLINSTCTGLDAEAYASIGRLSSLERLTLWQPSLAAEELVPITSAQTIRSISFVSMKMEIQLLSALAEMPKLTDLALDNVTGLTAEGLAALLQSQSVDGLVLTNIDVPQAAWDKLCTAKSIRRLDIRRLYVADENLDEGKLTQLAKSSAVTELAIANTYKLEGEAFRVFGKNEALKTLIVEDCFLETTALKALSGISSLRELSLRRISNTRLKRRDFDVLFVEALPLTSFTFEPMGKDSGLDETSLAKLVAGFPEIELLGLMNCPLLAKIDPETLGVCSRLKVLTLSDIPLDSEQVVGLSELPELAELTVGPLYVSKSEYKRLDERTGSVNVYGIQVEGD